MMKKQLSKFLVLVASVCCIQSNSFAQGTWKTLKNSAPNGNQGVMLLLTDGTVMALTEDTANVSGKYGNIWNLLTPDASGSYLNGTWSALPAMHNTRLYCSSQVMPNGNVYVAGGEYGSGGSTGEVFNTTTKTWTSAGAIPKNWVLDDANSKMLPDGTILEAVVISNAPASSSTLIYSPITNSYTTGPSLLGSSDEASWTVLPDGSIMNVDIGTENSERYIPKQKKWIKDANLPVYLYDDVLGESGVGFLLPNGNLFFLGDSVYTAIYTPTSTTVSGTWTQGPAMPKISNVQYGCPDAPAAMMVNGNILCAFSPAGTYNSPIYFYEYNYLTNAFTQVSSPTGGTKMSAATYYTTMLDLPDGTVLFAEQGSKSYYQYTPSGSPLAAGKPTINKIIPSCPSFMITGTLFNGISEGASYGDDWQMATNYPIVRFTSGTNVYYAKTTNWNRIGVVMTDTLRDTASFTIPTIPAGTYSVQVIANGIASDPYLLTLPCSATTDVEQLAVSTSAIRLYPNPNNGIFTLESSLPMNRSVVSIYNMLGEQVGNEEQITGSKNELDLSEHAAGVYFYRVFNENGALIANGKLVIQK